MKKHHTIINTEDLKKYYDTITRKEIFNRAEFYQAQTILLYGYSFKDSKENISKQNFTSNYNHHYDMVVVSNILEHLPLEYLGIVIKDIFSYSSKHVIVILNYKSDMFKPVINHLSKYPRHSFYFNA